MAPRWQRLELNDPNLIPSGKLLEMATIDGARIVGIDDITGSIEVGKEADIIIVNMWKPHLIPMWMETSRLAHLARGSDVETVMVQWAQKEAEHTWEVFGLHPILQASARHWGHSQE